jgi:hypothetical protein
MSANTRAAYVLGLAVILFCVVSCEPGYVKKTQKFADREKSVVNPDELQAWATNLIAKTPTPPVHDNNIAYLKEADIPQYIRAIDKEQVLDVYVANWEGSVVGEIWFGGGFGHWGLYVSSPGWTQKSSETHYLVEWKPGIYFWSGP